MDDIQKEQPKVCFYPDDGQFAQADASLQEHENITIIDMDSTVRKRPSSPKVTVPRCYTHSMSLSAVHPVDVRIRKLGVDVDVSPSKLEIASRLLWKRSGRQDIKPHTKAILDQINADLPSGTLTAILGGSGSGKTTLLNTVSERIVGKRVNINGTTTFNGIHGASSVRCAYVMQQDVLLPSLTVRETLQYSADLRLPSSTTTEERNAIVDRVILELGLKACADTRIGNHDHKGCSGGEKRRTSIGVQLLGNPSVLFLDEPTTGLDAASAFQLVRTLKALAKRGRTIVTTIHQPRSEIWGLFDRLILLSRGRPIYTGPTSESLPYFASKGFEMPDFVNPAEFLIDVAAIDNRSEEHENISVQRIESLQTVWRNESLARFQVEVAHVEHKHHDIEKYLSSAVNAIKSSGHDVMEMAHMSSQLPVQGTLLMLRRASFFRQLWVLTARTFKVTYRDPMGMLGSWLEAVGMGIVAGWVFFNLASNQSGIRSREGALYTAAALQGYLMLIFETYRLTIDIQLFDREHNEGVVDILPFLYSRRLARFFLEDFPAPFLYSIIFYWMAGFRADAGQFFVFFVVILLSQYVAVTFAMVCAAACRDITGATLIANLGYTVQSMSCGYFVQSQTVPVYMRWLKYIAYLYYGFGALVANEFSDQFYDCPYDGGESNPACDQYTGKFVLEALGIPQGWIMKPIVVLFFFGVMFYTVAAFGLWVKKVEMTVAKAGTTTGDRSVGKEKLETRPVNKVKTINVELKDFSLDLHKRNAYGRAIKPSTILHPINAEFTPGLLNVIMGPSGSGKTTLLNAMAHRLHDGFETQFKFSGQMTFNGALPAPSVVRSVCSYVCQDDDALLPSLTVRETLRYSASLRLPPHMSAAEKRARADEVLLKMGLKDCADNLIGGGTIKGISGGEKRRVSIAVQILTNPLVLLLDEPTSGLDAFTATSIIEVLMGLAKEGRTLILTIHQSRSDLFRSFGNVLLLAREGHEVFAGPSTKMLAHFEHLGFSCPVATNPADFALDLITVDLQQAGLEEATRNTVQRLVESWKVGLSAETKASSETCEPDHSGDGGHALITLPAQLGSFKRKKIPFYAAYSILLRRATRNIFRQRSLVVARIMQVIGLGIVLTLYFAPLHYDYLAVQSRIGFVQAICAMYFVGILQNVAVYPVEKDIFYREHDDSVYGVEVFLAVYTSLEVPFEIFTSMFSAVLLVFVTGLPRTAEMWGVMVVNIFCVVSCGESLGIMFNTLFNNTGFAVNMTSVIVSIAQFMTGIMSTNTPRFLADMNYLSPLHYAVRNLAPYSLEAIRFTCDAAHRLPPDGDGDGGECIIATGRQVLQLYRLDGDKIGNLAALCACAVVYRLAAWALLRLRRMRWDEVAAEWRARRETRKTPVAA